MTPKTLGATAGAETTAITENTIATTTETTTVGAAPVGGAAAGDTTTTGEPEQGSNPEAV